MKEIFGDGYSFYRLMYGKPEKIDENQIVQLPSIKFINLIDVVKKIPEQDSSESVNKKSLEHIIKNLENSPDNSSFLKIILRL